MSESANESAPPAPPAQETAVDNAPMDTSSQPDPEGSRKRKRAEKDEETGPPAKRREGNHPARPNRKQRKLEKKAKREAAEALFKGPTKFVIHHESLSASLQMRHVQELIMYICADGTLMKGLEVQNRLACPRLVVVGVPGLICDLWHTNGVRESLPKLRKLASHNTLFEPKRYCDTAWATTLFMRKKSQATDRQPPPQSLAKFISENIKQAGAPCGGEGEKEKPPPAPEWEPGDGKPSVESYLASNIELVSNQFPFPNGLRRELNIPKKLGKDKATVEALRAAGEEVEEDENEEDLPEGYQQTAPRGSRRGGEKGPLPLGARHAVMAMDCEMVQTKESDNQVARVTILDSHGEVIFDKYVKPDSEVVDYRTSHSGIQPEHLKRATLTRGEVLEELLDLIAMETILIGHSLENDFHSLGLCHLRVIDTSLVFPHKVEGCKSALRFLAYQHLSRSIQGYSGPVGATLQIMVPQSSSAGHCSKEDALACLDLVKKKVQNGPSFGVPPQLDMENVLDMVAKYTLADGERNFSSTIIGRDEETPFRTRTVSSIRAKNSEQVSSKLRSRVQDTTVKEFVWAQYHDLYHRLKEMHIGTLESNPWEEKEGGPSHVEHKIKALQGKWEEVAKDERVVECLREIDEGVSAAMEASLPGTLFLILGGQGPLGMEGTDSAKLSDLKHWAEPQRRAVVLFGQGERGTLAESTAAP